MNFFQAVNLTSYRHIPALNHNILIIQKVLVCLSDHERTAASCFVI